MYEVGGGMKTLARWMSSSKKFFGLREPIFACMIMWWVLDCGRLEIMWELISEDNGVVVWVVLEFDVVRVVGGGIGRGMVISVGFDVLMIVC